MLSASKKVFFADCEFSVFDDVYEPSEDSFLLAENLQVGKGDHVLDMGTGCGILGVLAARAAAEVVCVDINPHAVRCAQENAKINGVADRLLPVQGDLFGPFRKEEKFDLILFNAPYLPAERPEDGSWLARAWAGGADGRQVIDRFVSESLEYLKERGRILLLQSTLSGIDKTLEMFRRNRLTAGVRARRDLPFFEAIVLVEAFFENFPA
jgi:release factor glutamine methyltransferase